MYAVKFTSHINFALANYGIALGGHFCVILSENKLWRRGYNYGDGAVISKRFQVSHKQFSCRNNFDIHYIS